MVAYADDVRELLVNDGAQGFARDIQIPRERVTRLRAIMVDLDPDLLIPGNHLFPPADNPEQFFEAIEPILQRHPLAKHAEIRSSGRGLHVLIWLDPPLELCSAADQQRWKHMVRIIQRSLPSDSNAPDLIALTRPIGAINSKNGAVVECLKPGQAVRPAEVEEYVSSIAAKPFFAVAVPLLGAEQIQPCPVCGTDHSSLRVLDEVGRCYKCGTVGLDRLYDVAMRPFEN